MRDLKELFARIEYELIDGYLYGDISQIVTDVNKISQECLFVCIADGEYDSHQKIGEIIDGGAKVIVVDKKNASLAEFLDQGGVDEYLAKNISTQGHTAGFAGLLMSDPQVTIVGVDDTRKCLEQLELMN